VRKLSFIKQKIISCISSKYSISTITLVEKNLLIFGEADKQITLVNLTNPCQPEKLNTISINGWVNSIIKIDNTKIAFSDRGKQITLVDITDPYQPKKLPNPIKINHNIHSIIKIDNTKIAFSDRDKQITLVDITNPYQPKKLPNPIKINHDIHSIIKIDNTKIAFSVMSKVSTIKIVDIKQLKLSTSITIEGILHDFTAINNRLLALKEGNQITIVDISNLNNPKKLPNPISIQDSTFSSIEKINENLLIYGDLENAQIALIDITNPSHPKKIVNSMLSQNWIHSISMTKIKDNIFAFGGYDNQITFIHITDTNKIKSLTSINTGSKIQSLTKVSDNLLAFKDSMYQVSLIDITNLDHPKKLDGYHKVTEILKYSISRMSDHRLILRESRNKITLVDISDLNHPKKSSFPLEEIENITSITTLNNNFLAISTGQEIKLIDISNLNNPKKIPKSIKISNILHSIIDIDKNTFAIVERDKQIILVNKSKYPVKYSSITINNNIEVVAKLIPIPIKIMKIAYNV
jgi:hypothetical protein